MQKSSDRKEVLQYVKVRVQTIKEDRNLNDWKNSNRQETSAVDIMMPERTRTMSKEDFREATIICQSQFRQNLRFFGDAEQYSK